MRKIIKLAVREYNAAIRTKATIIMVVLMPVLMGGSMITMKILEKHVDTTDQHIAVVDRSGVVVGALADAATKHNANEITDLATGKRIKPPYVIDVVAPNKNVDEQRLDLSNQVRAQKLHAFVEIGAEVIHPHNTSPPASAAPSTSQPASTPLDDSPASHVAYYANNAALDDARMWMEPEINKRIRSVRLAEAGLDAEMVNQLTSRVPVDAMGLVSMDKGTGTIQAAERSNVGQAIGVPLGFMMLMFLMITVGSTPLINAVLEEKMQRIAEVLLGSVRPFQMMLGKLLGSVAVSFTVLAVYVAGAVYVLNELGWSQYIPYRMLPWFVVYQTAAICLYGALFVAIGAACNDYKEAQSLMLPVWLFVCFPMFVLGNVVREPLSSFSTWASLIPPFTPMLMMLRQTTPAAIPAWQPWVGLVGALLFTALCVWAAGRVFRVGILMQGKTPKLAELVRWAVRG